MGNRSRDRILRAMYTTMDDILTIAVLCAPASGGPYVSFSAGLTSTQYMMDGDTVMYDKIFVNEHNGYDKNKGIFTCPVSGRLLRLYITPTLRENLSRWLRS